MNDDSLKFKSFQKLFKQVCSKTISKLYSPSAWYSWAKQLRARLQRTPRPSKLNSVWLTSHWKTSHWRTSHWRTSHLEASHCKTSHVEASTLNESLVYKRLLSNFECSFLSNYFTEFQMFPISKNLLCLFIYFIIRIVIAKQLS